MENGSEAIGEEKFTRESALSELRESPHPLSAPMLAELTGTTRQTVHRRLEKEGDAEEWGLERVQYGQTNAYYIPEKPELEITGGVLGRAKSGEIDTSVLLGYAFDQFNRDLEGWVLKRRVNAVKAVSSLLGLFAVLALLIANWPAAPILPIVAVLAVVFVVQTDSVSREIAGYLHGRVLGVPRYVNEET